MEEVAKKKKIQEGQYPIDFVIPWVDGSDPEWQELRAKYSGGVAGIKAAQFRDWDVLRYWFRAVEKHAPWVRTIHFVTCGQIPAWLNTEHPKLNCVNHCDYIPEEYLPTFSSHVIEANFHRISGLSEHFVYFNDDMYLNADVKATDFFVDGNPCESPVLSVLCPSVIADPFIHYLCNNMAVINEIFSKKEVLRNSFFKWYNLKYGKELLKNIYRTPESKFSVLQNFHIASSMRKSTYEEVWSRIPDVLEATCRNRFRGLNDVNQYVMSWYNICKGDFEPRSTNFGKFYVLGLNDEEIYGDILTKKHKMICINDNIGEIDVDKEKENLGRVFEQAYPEKSSFER